MKDRQSYSYSRNNYFFGKLMTVRDFECEQAYFNDKRCLGNRNITGAGIVAGLDVILVDNKTISIEAGLALDYSGREIVIPKSVIKKVDSIEGFEENQGNGLMYLCIAYKQDLEETSFSIVGSGKDSSVGEEYNRVKEGYRLFFTSEEPDENVLNLDGILIDKIVLYDKDGVKLSLEVPKFVNPGCLLRVSAVLEKSNVQEPVSYKFSMSGDLFKGKNGEDSVEVSYQESEVTSYKVERKDYYLLCDAVSDAVAEIKINSSDFSIVKGNDFDRVDDDFTHKVNVTTKALRDVIINEYYSKSFEDVSDLKVGQNIYLAKLQIVSNQSTYFIENFERHPFGQYVISNDLLSLLLKSTYLNLPNCKNSQQGSKQLEQSDNIVSSESSAKSFDEVKSGVERIDLGLYSKSGKSYYSCEFVHGLGYGDVGVVLSIENKNTYVTNEPNSLLFGDVGVFKTEEMSISIPKVSLGAIVNVDKGTMKIGLKLLEKTSLQSIDIRWWAFKKEKEKTAISVEEDLSDDRNVSVVITPNTAQIKPLDQLRFTAEVNGSINQDVKWTLAEEGSGMIDDNGVYTAPAKCGVYEIKATSEEYVEKSDSAYIVVSDGE